MSDLRRAAALIDIKQYDDLEAAFRRSEQKPDGPTSAETAAILERIGCCYSARCDFRAAADHYRRAAAISDLDLADYAEVDRQSNASLC